MLGKSKETERELIFCQAKIERLEEQLKEAALDKIVLRQQISNLQEALISIRAPEAYRDQAMERIDSKRTPMSQEELERRRIESNVTTQYLNGLERPLFTSGEDLEDMLSVGLIRTQKGVDSLHGNEES